jgi:CubicO group peptidase (beta-lactamase class C family)
VAFDRKDLVLNTQLARAPARSRSIPAAAAACLTLVLVLLTAVSARAVAPTGPQASPPSAAPAAAAPATVAPAGVPLTAEDLNSWLDGYLPYALHVNDIAGAVVAVVKDGAIVTERGYGFADVARRKPVDPKLTLFRPGSVSKLFTWTAVMQQVEQGRIDLDGDINQYLDFKVTGKDGKPITMRNLMQHTAGFEEQAKGIISASDNLPSYAALLKQNVPARVFAVGSTPAYSNYGASLAGYIVERVAHEPFDDYVDRHIFEPLDMMHTSMRQPLPKALAPLMSNGYRVASADPHPFEFVGPAPALSASSTGEDMAHFMIAHLQNGEYRGKRILKAETAVQMHDSPYGDGIGPLDRMELGFFETNINGREVIAHLGDTEWFHTSLHLFLKENVGFYVSFNSPGKGGAARPLRIALFQDFADRYLPAAAPHAVQPKLDAATEKAHAALMAGAWTVSRGGFDDFLALLGFVGQMKPGLNKRGELLVAIPSTNGQPRHWVEVAPFVWQDVNSHDRLAAKVVDGRPVRWSYDTLSPFEVFDRTPWYQSSAWLMPLLVVSFAALLITALLWPVRALVRRHYNVPLALDAKSASAYRWSRIAAVGIVAALSLWGLFMVLILRDTAALGRRLDTLLLLAQLGGIVAFIGGFLVLLWNLLVVWGSAQRWPARTWSVVLAFSGLMVLWMALAFHLLQIGTTY